MGMTTGYGRLPLLAIVWIVVLWTAGAALYAQLDRTGAMRPNAPVVLRSPEWVLCATPKGEPAFLARSGATGRVSPARPRRSSPAIAASPRPLPIRSSTPDAVRSTPSSPDRAAGKAATGRPIREPPPATAGKWFMYFQGIAGLALGLLAVAGFSGIVKSN